MSHDPSHPGSRHFCAVSVPDLSTLSGAVNATDDGLDDLLEIPFFHPTDTPPPVSVGEHWVVANPTGGLELFAGTATLKMSHGAGHAPLRTLILDASARDTVPPVHLYWQVYNPDDRHEYTGKLGLAGVFDWLTFTPIVTDAAATGFDTPERERFAICSRPGPEKLVNGEELRQGTAAEVAVADNAGDTWAGRRALVASGPEEATAFNEAVGILTAADAYPAMITAGSR